MTHMRTSYGRNAFNMLELRLPRTSLIFGANKYSNRPQLGIELRINRGENIKARIATHIWTQRERAGKDKTPRRMRRSKERSAARMKWLGRTIQSRKPISCVPYRTNRKWIAETNAECLNEDLFRIADRLNQIPWAKATANCNSGACSKSFQRRFHPKLSSMSSVFTNSK